MKDQVMALKNSGVADEMKILPEFEFHMFDDARWSVRPEEIGFAVDCEQAYWNSANQGLGCVVPHQKNYHVAKPFDKTYECRSEMCLELEKMGIEEGNIIRLKSYFKADDETVEWILDGKGEEMENCILVLSQSLSLF